MQPKNEEQNFYEKVNSFVSGKVDDLIQNINNQQEGVLLFNELRQGFSEFQQILGYLREEEIKTLPSFKQIELEKRLNPLFSYIDKIQNLKKDPSQTDQQQKNQIINFFKLPFNKASPDKSGFFAKEKDAVWDIIIQAISLSNSRKKTDSEAASILKRVKEIEVNAAKSEAELSKILTSAKSELSKSGVEVHSQIFSDQADKNSSNSLSWRRYTIILGIITLVIAIGFFLIISLAISDIKQIIETSILAGVIVSILTYMITLTVKNFFAEKHNESINRHKANCLSTFNTFVDSADEDRKSAVLLQATYTIFSHQSSGYISNENEINNPNPVVEIARNIVNKQNSVNT